MLNFFRTLDIDTWHLDRKYDVISCLNLIDRCDTPLELMHQMRDTLAPEGRVLLAVVLPFSAYVESGTCHVVLYVREVIILLGTLEYNFQPFAFC